MSKDIIGTQCQFSNCSEEGKFRCSRCRLVHYCGQEHQKLDWATHKHKCIQITSNPNNTAAITPIPSSFGQTSSKAPADDSRVCRCMFCGEEMLMQSEAEAVDHMRVCPALQEQLQSKEQFTIPSILKDKMKRNDS